MIGRFIDRAAFSLLGTTGLYLFFLNAGIGIFASSALTFVCAALLRYMARNRPHRYRMSTAQAEAALLNIVLLSEYDSEAALRTLTGKSEVVCIIKHPQSRLTLDEMFALWQAKGDGVSVAVTCGLDSEAARFARSRGIEVIEKGALVKRLRKTGLYVQEPPTPPSFLRRMEDIWIKLRLRPRMAAYSMGLLVMYAVTGRTLCLVCGLGLLGVMGAKLIERYA